MKIPTIAEIRDSPQLQPWIDRASRNVVVTSVKTFVERAAHDLQSRAAEMNVPSVGELAERIAAWMARRQAGAPHAQINATGALLPAQASTPLADEALHVVQATLRDYVTTCGHGVEDLGEIRGLMRQLTGADACVVTSSASSGMLLALSAVCREKPLVVARGQVGEMESGVTLPQIARCAGVTLRECGIVERVSLEDYQEVLPGAGAVLVACSPPSVRLGAEMRGLLRALATAARRQQTPLVVELGWGGIVDPARYQLSDVMHATEILELGADVVLMSGARLLGGPACGILLGTEEALEGVRRHPLHGMLAAAPLVLMPLAATLELHRDLEIAERAIPILSLLSTSLENLHSRAARMVPQLASHPLIESITVSDGPAYLHPGDRAPSMTSCHLRIKPKGTTAAAIAERLARGMPSLLAGEEEGILVVNLRTVFPRQDMHLVEAFDALREGEGRTPEIPSANDELPSM
jgi:L-seryl-tRNA(Ser) seleniumtransferase